MFIPFPPSPSTISNADRDVGDLTRHVAVALPALKIIIYLMKHVDVKDSVCPRADALKRKV